MDKRTLYMIVHYLGNFIIISSVCEFFPIIKIDLNHLGNTKDIITSISAVLGTLFLFSVTASGEQAIVRMNDFEEHFPEIVKHIRKNIEENKKRFENFQITSSGNIQRSTTFLRCTRKYKNKEIGIRIGINNKGNLFGSVADGAKSTDPEYEAFNKFKEQSGGWKNTQDYGGNKTIYRPKDSPLFNKNTNEIVQIIEKYAQEIKNCEL